jgi:hypothetical protein
MRLAAASMREVPHRNTVTLKAPDHIGGSSATGKGNGSVRLAFVDHLLVSQMPGAFAVRAPIRRVAFDGDTVSLGPMGAESIRATRLAFD